MLIGLIKGLYSQKVNYISHCSERISPNTCCSTYHLETHQDPNNTQQSAVLYMYDWFWPYLTIE